MTNKKKMILALTAVLVLSVTMGAFAATQTCFTFDGNCKKNFLTSGSIKKDSGTWAAYHIYLTSMSPCKYNYAFARPETSDGKTCGTKFEITLEDEDGTEYIPNDRGKSASEVHAKIYNPLNEKGDSSTTSLNFKGSMTGTK